MKTATPPECALAYALWDAENSVKMCKPEDVQEHIDRARLVKTYLKVHGYTLRRKGNCREKSHPSQCSKRAC